MTQVKLEIVTECNKCPPWEPRHKGHNFWTEHVAANSCLYAQAGIGPSIVVMFHQIPTSGVGGVAFTRILDGQEQHLIMPIHIS